MRRTMRFVETGSSREGLRGALMRGHVSDLAPAPLAHLRLASSSAGPQVRPLIPTTRLIMLRCSGQRPEPRSTPQRRRWAIWSILEALSARTAG